MTELGQYESVVPVQSFTFDRRTIAFRYRRLAPGDRVAGLDRHLKELFKNGKLPFEEFNNVVALSDFELGIVHIERIDGPIDFKLVADFSAGFVVECNKDCSVLVSSG